MTSDMQNSPQHSNAPQDGKQGGLPMRGLAMILIAVAVLLAAWALWSMQGKNDDSVSTTASTQATETNPGTLSADVAGSEAADTPAPAPADAHEEPAADAEKPAGQDAPAAPAPRDNSVPVSTLYVLNNSTVSQLAARVADDLSGDYEKVESGNLPDAVIPQNTVYFTPGNPAAEKSARELADRVGGVAKERSAVLPSETAGKDAIVLVLVQDVAL
ncbi:LytR C-terminal domain-containing protein [Corynebacterium crudilactis]|uniref:LytR/CpsA/Psr regulator C-terminal domain-containing protein n=1 Tax=Corynebacterium crudilactis TaxID=1652495 RepID=A0A172QW86_9CORY|nr:LytR C-terminal domain-containing protein [Corynebacterium crudilactis]ANE04911.1 hypothetical protein ccrud_12355 [Corynebacterium crudilactis]